MTALQLVDYVSRQYSIRISMAVWQELLEWAYVLSLPRFGPRMEENSEGQIPREVVTDILRTMSAPPYRVVPNMVMVNIMAKHAFLRNVFSDLHKYMEMGYKIFLRTMKERNRLRRTLVRHELCIAPMPTVSEQEAWEMRERLYLQRLEEELEKERRKRNGEAVDDTAVGSTDRQQQQQRETEDWVDDVALPAKEGEGELHRYHQLAYLEASEGNANEDVRDEVILPDEEVPSGTGTGTGIGIGTGNESTRTAAPQGTAKTDVGYVGTAGSAGAGAAAAAAAGTSPANANASAGAAAPGSAGEVGAESGAAARSDDASATRAAGTSTSTNSGSTTSTETSPETVSEAERKEAADTTISRSTSTSTCPTYETTLRPPNLHEEQRSKALRARIRAALATYYRTTGTREPYNPVPGFELQLRNVAREAEPVPEHLNPDHLPLLSRRGEEGEGDGEGGGSRGRSPRRSVLIARYNDLYRQARSARTHPMLHGTLVRTIDEGFNEGDGEGNSNAVERPRLSDYETAHLTLSKIKAFRHLNSALHITARELARDVALLQRWVRLVLLGHRWVADSAGGPLEWQRRALPRFVERWRPFMARATGCGIVLRQQASVAP
ncbi:hypothetical protein KEM55_005704 [Ascosphaera atra]|nr:hypothetical protein KEM55_005704 [Ascosphaera atra]